MNGTQHTDYPFQPRWRPQTGRNQGVETFADRFIVQNLLDVALLHELVQIHRLHSLELIALLSLLLSRE